MIISRGRRYIFVHIPKTGGTSLALALEARAMADDILIGDTPKARRRRGRVRKLAAHGRLWKHSTLADIDGVVGTDELDEFFLITLVRNPWDRLVSYYHWLRGQSFEHPAVRLAASLGFSDFLNHEQTRATIGAWPYGRYMTDSTGHERASHFVRLEHLAEDMAPFEQHLGFPLTPLAHCNRSERPADYRKAYTDADARLVAGVCAADIARFGYSF